MKIITSLLRYLLFPILAFIFMSLGVIEIQTTKEFDKIIKYTIISTALVFIVVIDMIIMTAPGSFFRENKTDEVK